MAVRTPNLKNPKFVTAFTGSAKNSCAGPVVHALKIMPFTHAKQTFK
jgi:hypothetical protein